MGKLKHSWPDHGGSSNSQSGGGTTSPPRSRSPPRSVGKLSVGNNSPFGGGNNSGGTSKSSSSPPPPAAAATKPPSSSPSPPKPAAAAASSSGGTTSPASRSKSPTPSRSKSPTPSSKSKPSQEATTTLAAAANKDLHNPRGGPSGKASQDTIAALTKDMVTSVTIKTVEDQESTRIMMLLSTTSGSRRQLSQQERSIQMLEALEIPFETLNCALPEMKFQRDDYFDLSGIRGEFPQFFLIEGAEGTTSFIGQFDDLETINEKSNFPNDALKENDITWDSLFGCTTTTYNHKGISCDGIDYSDSDDDDSDGSGGGNIYADL